MSTESFVKSGLIHFLDVISLAVMGWLYWLVISQIFSTAEIGQASKIISLVLLISILCQLGLEYPLLKKSSKDRTKIFGTILSVELIITLAFIPILFYVINFVYNETEEGYSFLAIGILLSIQVAFLTRYTLLGISKVKEILIIDLVGIASRFLVVFILISAEFGTLIILSAFLVHFILVSLFTLAVVMKKKFGLRPGSFVYTKKILKDGLVNSPSKYSRLIIFSLSVVLLATFEIPDSEIGIFYIALMISMIGSGLASSISIMSIPVSAVTKIDLSSSSLRVGLSVSVPIIAVLLVAPGYTITLLGEDFASGEQVLFILALGILPYIVIHNAVVKFNNLNKSKELIVMGAVLMSTFLSAFWLLVPQFQSEGASTAILIGFIITSILTLIWSERKLFKFIIMAMIAVGISSSIGYLLLSVLYYEIIVIVITAAIAFVMVLALKLTSTTELGGFIKNVIKKTN